MRGAVKGLIVGGVFATMVAGAGYGVSTLLDEEVGNRAGGVARERSGAPSKSEVSEAASEFLAAWSRLDGHAAASLTNNPVAAQSAVTGFRDRAHVTKAAITPGEPTGTKVPFTVRAEVSFEGKTKPWSYESSLVVVRGKTTGRPLVDWQPDVLHPQLKEGESLRAGQPTQPPVMAVDRNGRELSPEQYPSLRPVLDTLREKYGAQAGGRPGVELWIQPALAEAPPRTLLTVAEGRAGRIRTRLDADVQAAAERAVSRYPESSVVAIKPRTGDILAVANNRQDGFDAALSGRLAPGSTMKIVTAAMLLDKGLVAADKVAECPKEASWGGYTFHNLNGFSLEGSTFARSFARSCNTAFIKLIDDTGDEAALSTEAREAFGIGLQWRTGVPTFDGRVPPATGAEAAAAYIGQGRVQMNPLTIASVTATAKTGVFRQPVIVSPSLIDGERAHAERRLRPTVARQLRKMMRLTASSGTGARAMASVRGDTGAKTGSAETGSGDRPDSWFTGFRDDLAVAAVVQGGGHGGDAAGPLVAQVLRAG
ncbi:penicillin-binding transpeptidase domain-containing protein [Streptomyces sp. NPDC006879]|uniref:penicillin-binding transpeptidase domain-containing protein n=1 Tax=Streptomyces sp. NPDC006879 TaxID=3364767 RepID=UPI003685BE8B